MNSTPGPTYREVARRVRRYAPEALLREIARLGAAEAQRRLQDGSKVEPPETAFTFAGLARTVLAETRSGGALTASAGQSRKRARHRRNGVGPDQVRALCRELQQMWTPEILTAGEKDASVLMASFLFDQLGSQWSPMENLSRAHSLFVDAVSKHPDLPDAQAWKEVLGVDFDAFMRTGFALNVAMMQNQGQMSRDVLKASNVRPIWEPLTPDQLFDVVDRHFALDLDDHQRRCREAQVDGWEKESFNSLAADPLINLGDDLVAPAPHFLLDKVSSTGLWYVGREAWGDAFTTALGHAFEDYVGQHLALLQHAALIPEISHPSGKGEKRSCDWIVVTKDAVLLVEVKCARPLYGYRQGDPTALEDLRGKVEKAVGQLETTAHLIRARHPSFAQIPDDRPLVGLVVTLEPYYLRETLRDDMLNSAVLPIASAWAHELENACAQLSEDPDVGAMLLEGLTPKLDPLVVSGSLRAVAYEGPVKRNPIIDASWDAWASWPAFD